MKIKGSVIGAAIAGLFVGAASAIAVTRNPKAFKNIGEATRKTLAAFTEAFKEGYYGRGSDRKKLTTGG